VSRKKSRLGEVIERLNAEQPLERHFDWDVPSDCPLQMPTSLKGSFERNLYLKEHFGPFLLNDPDFEAHFWLIREWGGIKSFKNTQLNRERIMLFRAQLAGRKMTREIFSVISSLSKIAAFEDCERFAIYDSRVIAALNWLIFLHEDYPQLFPQPPGRNSALLECDPNTLMRLSGKTFGVRNHKTAFFEYCELLRELSDVAMGGKKIYHLEMLLFVAAPGWIVEDIKKRTTVTIR